MHFIGLVVCELVTPKVVVVVVMIMMQNWV